MVLCNVVGSSAKFLFIQKRVILQCCVDYANCMCYFPWELENGYVLIYIETSYFTTVVLIMLDYIQKQVILQLLIMLIICAILQGNCQVTLHV
jgi:hypothetical protein